MKTRDEFLKELEKELEANGFVNTDDILDKYRKRYDFGLESEMTDEEIQNRLGSPKEIVKKMVESSGYDHKPDEKDTEPTKFNIEINTVSDNVRFEESTDGDTHIYMDDIEETSYNIVNNDREIFIGSLTKKFFGLNRRRPGLFTIALPTGFKVNKLKLNSASGDFVSKIDLDSKSFNLSIVSGDCEFKKITANEFKTHAVSGDIEIEEINTDIAQISSVSGDIDIDYLLASDLKVDTVSGTIKILEASHAMNIKSTSISGTILIDGKKFKNVTTKVKEVFKSEHKAQD